MSLGARELRVARAYTRDLHRWEDVIFHILDEQGHVCVQARPACYPPPAPSHVMVHIAGEDAPRVFYVDRQILASMLETS